MHRHTRAQFFTLGAAGTLAAVAAPSAWAQGPAPAPQGDDIGFVQWAATAELVAVACWDGLATYVALDPRADRWVHAMRRADTVHRSSLDAVLGEDAPTGDDFAVELPKGSFRSLDRGLALAEDIHDHTVRVYLAGVAQAADPGTRLLLGQLLVSDTQHLDAVRALRGRSSVSGGLRGPLDLEAAGTWLDRFLRVPS